MLSTFRNGKRDANLVEMLLYIRVSGAVTEIEQNFFAVGLSKQEEPATVVLNLIPFPTPWCRHGCSAMWINKRREETP